MPRPVVPSRCPALTRRGLLALAALGSGVAFAGCDPDPGVAPGSAGTLVVTPSPLTSPDRALVEQALARATSLLVAAEELGRRRRRLRRRLAPLGTLHGRQVEVLTSSVAPATATPSVSPAPSTSTLAALLATEESWVTSLAAAAETAQDGAVARLLAVLAAGSAMALDSVSAQPLPPLPAPTGEALPDDTDLLQQTLATEHAVLYAYGVVGGRTSQTRDADLFAAMTAAYDAHRARRDDLEALLRAAGADPVTAAAAYDVPPPGSRAQVVTAAGGVERAAAEQYAALVAAAPPGRRTWAATLVRDAALRAGGYGLTPEPFFGAPELAGA
jgi:hypothetical protein